MDSLAGDGQTFATGAATTTVSVLNGATPTFATVYREVSCRLVTFLSFFPSTDPLLLPPPLSPLSLSTPHISKATTRVVSGAGLATSAAGSVYNEAKHKINAVKVQAASTLAVGTVPQAVGHASSKAARPNGVLLLPTGGELPFPPFPFRCPAFLSSSSSF